jgi:hypothetical protein
VKDNQNRPDSARQASVRRREFKFDAVWENEINLEFKPDAAQKKEEEKKNGDINAIQNENEMFAAERNAFKAG